ncbi:MAG: diaminopimelate epimerase [Gemmatimonadales bacterium]|nr:diaminopimelate epimerase [Gemmatimonadales bacterium]
MHIYKMTGSGNDFVMLDGRVTALEAWPSERIRAVCDRRTGVGADGLVRLSPEAEGVRFEFFNADGSRGEMCGNAALCSVRLASRIGLSPAPEVRLLTDAGTVVGRTTGGTEAAEIDLPPFPMPEPVGGVPLEPGELSLWFGVVGVPHVVVKVEKVDEVDVLKRGRTLRWHDAFGRAGANVNFVSRPVLSGGPWRIRTFERGVEGETLACGTGTVCAAYALAVAGDARLPADFVSWGGFPLRVGGVVEGSEAAGVRLGGMGRLVFEADLRAV